MRIVLFGNLTDPVNHASYDRKSMRVVEVTIEINFPQSVVDHLLAATRRRVIIDSYA